MSATALPLDAPIHVRQVWALRSLLPPHLQGMSATAREVRAAFAAIVRSSPAAVMPTRSESRAADAWIRARGIS